MKRSEIINYVSNFLYEHNLEPDEAIEEAEKLLNKLEEFGMLPPTRELPYEYYKGKLLEVKKVNTWEPEDD